MAWAAIDPNSKMLAIGAAKSEHHLCQQIPGCNYSKVDQLWRVPLSWPAYVCLKTIFRAYPLRESQELQDWAASAWADVRLAYSLRGTLDAPEGIQRELIEIEGGQHNEGAVDVGKALLTPPQRGGAAWLALLHRRALTDPQGNGKTPQVIRALQLLARKNEGLPALIVCTLSAIYDWADAFAKWAPELTVRAVTGTAVKRRDAILSSPPADVYLIPWSTLRYHTRLAAYPGQAFVRCPKHGGVDTRVTAGRCEVHEKEFDQIGFRTVIPDEAHRMKEAKSKWTRAVWYLGHRADNFWPLTGTPIVANIGDIWPIMHGLDPKGFPAKSRFLDLFAIKSYDWHRGDEIEGIRPDTEAAYHGIVQPMVRRIPKEVARPWMPARLPFAFRYPELTTDQAKAYRQLSKQFLADIDGGLLTVANYGVRFGRLCYLASATVELADGEDEQGFTLQHLQLTMPSNKVDDLVEFLGDNPGQLVVAANTPKLLALAERKLASIGISHCKIIGGMTASDRHQSVRWFQDGQCRVIFLSPRAGGESITLTAADTVFFMQPTPSYDEREQVIGRVDRIGQVNPVRAVFSMSPGTVDKRLFELSESKERQADSFNMDTSLMRWIVAGDQLEDSQEVLF